MKSGFMIAALVGAAGFLVTWGCSSTPDVETNPPVGGSQIQVLVLDYPHGSYLTGDKIDVECLNTGNQGNHETGEGCDCLHLHSGSGISIVGSTATTADMAPSECGHGCLVVTSSLTIDLYCGGLDVDDPNHPRKGLCVQAPCGT